MSPKAAAKTSASKAPVAKTVPAAKAAAPKAVAKERPAGKAVAKAAPKSPAGAGAAAVKALKAEARGAEDAFNVNEDGGEEVKEVTKDQSEKEGDELNAKVEDEKRKMKETEAQKERSKKMDGEVVLKYNMYNEKFPIKGGCMLATEIDEVYCLSDVMPGCKIHLSLKSSEDKYKLESSGEPFPYVFEDPVGTFHDLEAGESYFVFVEEDEAEFLKSQERAKANFAGVRSEKTRGEGCSCIEGNPCASECDAQGNSVCLDWANRFAVAKANGWIGYQAK